MFYRETAAGCYGSGVFLAAQVLCVWGGGLRAECCIDVAQRVLDGCALYECMTVVTWPTPIHTQQLTALCRLALS